MNKNYSCIKFCFLRLVRNQDIKLRTQLELSHLTINFFKSCRPAGIFFNKKLLIVAEFEAMDISSGCKFLSVHFIMFLTEKWKGRYHVRGRERL